MKLLHATYFFGNKRFRYKALCLIILMLAFAPIAAFAQAEQELPSLEKLLSLPEELHLPEMAAWQQELLNNLDSGNFSAAEKILLTKLANSSNKLDKFQNLELLAYLEQKKENYAGSLKYLAEAEKQATEQGSGSTNLRLLNYRRTGEVFLRMQKIPEAIASYKSALSLAHKVDQTNIASIDILTSIIGCYTQDNRYEAAQPYAEEALSTAKLLAKKGQLIDIAALFWSYVQLLEIYDHTNPEKHAKTIAEMQPLLNLLFELHTKTEADNWHETEEIFKQIRRGLLCSYIEQCKPDTLADYLWQLSEFKMPSLPLIQWLPQTGHPDAIILCVHGLGLENRTFASFGKTMAGKQFATYALDVRGFGAWQSETGKQTVNFDKALADVKAVIKILKTRHPGLPVFLLGESMGGAIALRAASEYGNEMAGVVASVPSAERYGEAEMAVNVAIHYLNDRKKQINMASIAKKATSNEELREFWKDDLRSRTRLSPLELIKFDHFMKTTQHRCSSITDTPVMLVQGLSDQLVKPQGTYEMYDNIKSPDKVMIIIGNAEHLIFETPEQPQILLGGLDAWLKHHCAKPAH